MNRVLTSRKTAGLISLLGIRLKAETLALCIRRLARSMSKSRLRLGLTLHCSECRLNPKSALT